MENLSALAITSLSHYSNVVYFKTSAQPKPTSAPTKEMVEHLNKIGNEYPFCVYHKHRNNDPL